MYDTYHVTFLHNYIALLSVLVYDMIFPTLQSVLVYDIIGEGNSLTQFKIDANTGVISLAVSLLNTGEDSYLVSLHFDALSDYMYAIFDKIKFYYKTVGII